MECISCKEADVEDWIAEYCCSGRECGCMGLPIEPPLCDKCWEKVTLTLPQGPLSTE